MREAEMMPDFRLRRSALYMPGSNGRAMDKAQKLAADILILDLEDAVAPEAKDDARQLVAEKLRANDYGTRERLVRVNGLASSWIEADMAMTAALAIEDRCDGLVVPKIENVEQLLELDRMLSAQNAPPDMGLWLMIETPMAILNLPLLAGRTKETRLIGLIMGTNDLALEMALPPAADRLAFQTSLSYCILAAKAHGLVALDGVYNDLDNMTGFEGEAVEGLIYGFDGKTLIHPDQLEIANRLFSPSAAEIIEAQAIVAAFADPANAGKGVIRVNGKITEILHLQMARQKLAMDAAIKGRN